MPTVAELLEALPVEEESTQDDASSDLLRDLQQRLASKTVPTGSLRRLLSLGGLNARIGVAYFAYWMRSWFRVSTSNQVRVRCTKITPDVTRQTR